MNISRLKKKREIREKYAHAKNPCFTVFEKSSIFMSLRIFLKMSKSVLMGKKNKHIFTKEIHLLVFSCPDVSPAAQRCAPF